MKNKQVKQMVTSITGLRYGPIPNYGAHCSLWLCGPMSVTESLRRTRVFNSRVSIKACDTVALKTMLDIAEDDIKTGRVSSVESLKNKLKGMK